MPEEKTRFEISADELEHRMARKAIEHDAPIQKAVEILEAALEKVMTSLGVDVEGDIPAQQEALGITLMENTAPETPKLNGFFVFKDTKGGLENIANGGDMIPVAWIGDARIDHLGRCYCDINWFKNDKLDEVGGVRIVQ